MPEPTKKIMVKVAKKKNPEAEEAKKGIYDKETIADAKAEGYVPKGLTKDFIAKVNETSEINTKRNAVESIAKNDSVVGAKKAKFDGKDLVDQARAGNKAANETRVKGSVPQVARGREYVNDSNLTDKYSTGTSTSTRDSYSRTNPLEKEMPKAKKIMVKVKKA